MVSKEEYKIPSSMAVIVDAVSELEGETVDAYVQQAAHLGIYLAQLALYTIDLSGKAKILVDDPLRCGGRSTYQIESYNVVLPEADDEIGRAVDDVFEDYPTRTVAIDAPVMESARRMADMFDTEAEKIIFSGLFIKSEAQILKRSGGKTYVQRMSGMPLELLPEELYTAKQ